MSNDDEWVKKIIEECVRDAAKRKMNELETFKDVIKKVLEHIGGILDETWLLWEKEPDSKKLKKKFMLLEEYVSCLFWFCQRKGENEK